MFRMPRTMKPAIPTFVGEVREAIWSPSGAVSRWCPHYHFPVDLSDGSVMYLDPTNVLLKDIH